MQVELRHLVALRGQRFCDRSLRLPQIISSIYARSDVMDPEPPRPGASVVPGPKAFSVNAP
jgi:hypothetical protein